MYGRPPAPPRPVANELWQHSLSWLEESINVSLPHELDVRRMTKVLKGLWAVGERPTYDEFKRYLRRLWPEFPSTQRQVRELWRTIERNPHHRFRRITRHDEPLHIVDLVCERHQLRPPEVRLRSVAALALEAVQDTPQPRIPLATPRRAPSSMPRLLPSSSCAAFAMEREPSTCGSTRTTRFVAALNDHGGGERTRTDRCAGPKATGAPVRRWLRCVPDP